ncbi:MAG: MjaII restriction endonuclease [Candidatus Bathyarchaeota archaeon BA2]|nr:MAG: MjaII restriction endonuclease [Candidatus Bathyarchaeota archaeon BA2]
MIVREELRNKIRKRFERFLRERAKTIMKLHVQNLNINPFLMKLLAKEMGLTGPREIVRWLVQQRLERGTVTSFGKVLEDTAKIFSEATAVEGADIMTTRNGRHNYMQVKSGPNTVPKDLAVRITQLLESARRRNRGSVVWFGMCYGNPEQVSSIVKKYVSIDFIIGRKFWEFISGDPNCIDEIFEIADEVSNTFRGPEGKSLRQNTNEKLAEIEREFAELYGSNSKIMWENLLKYNS